MPKNGRGNHDLPGAMLSYISLEERVPAKHPLRKTNTQRVPDID